MALQSFPRFLGLPMEIQIQIWEQAVLSLHFSPLPSAIDPQAVKRAEMSIAEFIFELFFNTADAPIIVKIHARLFLPLMHVCVLSRSTVLDFQPASEATFRITIAYHNLIPSTSAAQRIPPSTYTSDHPFKLFAFNFKPEPYPHQYHTRPSVKYFDNPDIQIQWSCVCSLRIIIHIIKHFQ